MTSALPLLVVVAAIVVLGVTGNLLPAPPLVIAIQLAAIALSIWSRRAFRPGTFRVTAAPGADSIIANGPYRVVRHPMYAAALLFVWAGVISHISALTLTIGAVVTAVVITRIVVEERLLRRRYPEYADYARRTKALVPYLF